MKKNVEYDYLCSIEGGFEVDYSGLPYVVTYVVFEDNFGNKSTGKSLGLRITNKMMEYVSNGGSLNKLIELLNGVEKNKQNGSISSYLSGMTLSRQNIDNDAVSASFVPILYKEKRVDLYDLIDVDLSYKNK